MVGDIVENAMNIVTISLSLLLIALERILTGVTLLLPTAVLEWCGNTVRSMVPRSEEQIELEADNARQAHISQVSNSNSFVEMCEIFGYHGEEHIVVTQDGYLLAVHRILRPHRSHRKRLKRRPVVYLHHGLLMNSEVWVAVPDRAQSVAFQLADAGYDVWLGNNRGNKYSKKHLHLSSNSSEFWNFGLDEFALYDIPAIIDYVLDVTGASSLAYLGFSQGSAQAFAALSIHPALNKKIRVFIALGPAMAPPGINPFVQGLMDASPSLLYMVFGHRIILRSAMFWQSIMIPALYVQAIDFSLEWLFRWRGHNISWAQRLTGYSHLYSYTSVKAVVHWFQIIRSQVFQMYDDDTLGPFAVSRFRFYQVPPYPTRNIQTRIEIIYGTADTLVDIEALLSMLPKERTGVTAVDGYEHLEMIWGRNVPTVIVPRILEILRDSALDPS